MMIKNFFISSIFCSVAYLSPVWAEPDYANAMQQCSVEQQDEQAIGQCLDRVIDKVDRELQTWVNNQAFILEELALKTGRSSALSMFKRSQNNFVKYQEDNCRWQYLAISPDKTAGTAYKKCYIYLSLNRIDELKQSGKP
jgi:uncharacterized protein YecT (DUF1311 family)